MSTSHIDWRWSASPLTILGLHYSVLVFFLPLLFSQLSWYVILAFALYCAFLVWCRRKSLTPWSMVRFLIVRLHYGDRYSVRPWR
jgi:hypothetical protein